MRSLQNLPIARVLNERTRVLHRLTSDDEGRKRAGCAAPGALPEGERWTDEVAYIYGTAQLRNVTDCPDCLAWANPKKESP